MRYMLWGGKFVPRQKPMQNLGCGVSASATPYDADEGLYEGLFPAFQLRRAVIA